MALLFLWMLWKKEKTALFMSVLIFGTGIFIVQDLRHESIPAYSGTYEGHARFQEGFKAEGDSVRGFMELEDGGLVYGSYRFATPEEKESMEGSLRNSLMNIKGV